MDSYGQRTIDRIAEECERRGIPEPEQGSVRQHLAEKAGAESLEDAKLEHLKRINRNIDAWMRDYLDGRKRRPGVAEPGPWEEPTEPEGEGTATGEASGDVEEG